MGRHSRKQKKYHDAYLVTLSNRVSAIAVGVPLPLQPIIHTNERPSPGDPGLFRTSDGRTYAIDRNGSFRRAPEGFRVMDIPRE